MLNLGRSTKSAGSTPSEDISNPDVATQLISRLSDAVQDNFQTDTGPRFRRQRSRVYVRFHAATCVSGKVFDCCDTDDSGELDLHELKFALNAFGLFPSLDYLRPVFESQAGLMKREAAEWWNNSRE